MLESPNTTMLSLEVFAGVIRQLRPPRFGVHFKQNLDRMYQTLMDRFAAEQPTRYLDFILHTKEGRRRAWQYLALFAEGLMGEPDGFLKDQTHIGFVRAQQGFRLEDVFQFTLTFKEILWKFISEYESAHPPEESGAIVDDSFYVHQLIDYSYILLCRSFLKTRDELILLRNTQLHSLHSFTASFVAEQDEDRILTKTLQAVPAIVRLEAFFLVVERGRDGHPGTRCRLVGETGTLNSMTEIIREARASEELWGRNEDGSSSRRAEDNSDKFFTMLVAPLRSGLGADYRLVLHKNGSPFRVDDYDKSLLYQLCYFAGGVLFNAQALRELAEKKEELRKLAGKLISFQEQERKRLASDIHDTLTQALTGIGYKALLCQELVSKDPGRLTGELDELTTQVNEGLRQSRQIIGNLHPSLLDVVGLVAAMKNLVVQFANETGVRSSFRSPVDLTVPSEVGIAAYRVVQESLANVKKHAAARNAEVRLRILRNGNLSLTVEDDGQGFHVPRRGRVPTRGQGLGLLSMRERAEDLGGSFAVASRNGGGCRIQVTFPLSQER
jgi:signal transduction histidine kinase